MTIEHLKTLYTLQHPEGPQPGIPADQVHTLPVNWQATPEQMARPREYPDIWLAIDVWDCRADLILLIKGKRHYIPYDHNRLTEAIEEYGGAINASGWYPINQTITNHLKNGK